MKIIQPGDLNRLKKIKRFECEYCGCIFEADQSEYWAADAMAALHDGLEATCKCPCCHRDVSIYAHRFNMKP